MTGEKQRVEKKKWRRRQKRGIWAKGEEEKSEGRSREDDSQEAEWEELKENNKKGGGGQVMQHFYWQLQIIKPKEKMTQLSEWKPSMKIVGEGDCGNLGIPFDSQTSGSIQNRLAIQNNSWFKTVLVQFPALMYSEPKHTFELY